MSNRSFAERDVVLEEAGCHSPAQPPQPREHGSELSRLRNEVQRLREEQHRLVAQVHALSRAVEARDAFLARAACELRNPMGGILLGISSMLHKTQAAADVPGWVHPRLEAIDRQARWFIRRAGVLLDVLRVASGGIRLELREVCLGDLVGDVVRDLAVETHSGHCEMRLETEAGVIGTWDRAAIEEVAFHFLSNAVRYGAGRPIEVEVSQAGGVASLRVRDHGMGISQADRDRIFADFEDVALRVQHPGFGMGLWIARHLVEAHGGQISVESPPGGGSVFTARLPQAIHVPQP
jgi:signal transduction histidine kinase